MSPDLSFTNKIRLRSNGKSPASRHFVTVDKKVSKQIQQATADQPRRGRGSIKVAVRIGFVKRKTSIFPDKKSDSYILPIKAAVREELHIGAGDEVLVYLDIL